MSKYNKAIGATVGAAIAWLAAFGLGDGVSLFGITPESIDAAITAIGAVLGAWLAPKNKEA